jgi:formylglycine-generating enzyme required for sulfatase activity
MKHLLIILSILLLSSPLFGQSEKSEGSWTEPITGIKFLYIPGGTFVMGSPTTEEGRQQFAETQHPVTVGTFWLAETEVTQAQWKVVMGENPSDFKGDDRPVEKVNWYDVQEFIKKLNSRTGKQFRLPTEAEWEYAARAGTMTVRYWGEVIGRNHANCNGCGSHWDYRQTAPVKSFAPNGFGLYDMLGNVWEWTCSAYDWSYGGSENKCVNQAEHVSIRGGSWFHKPRWMRASHRRFTLPHFRPFFYGFRLARG